MNRNILIAFCCSLLIVLGCATANLPTQQGVEDRQYGNLDIDTLTDSPQYVFSAAHLNVPPDVVFDKIADHENLRDWVPMIDHLVEVDSSRSITPGQPNVGTVRICDFGGDRLVEEIRYWQEGVGYAYSIRDHEDIAVAQHVGVLWVESDQQGGAYLIWRQFFEKKPWSMKAHIMPIMMSYVMDSAMGNLVEEWGGEVL